MKPVTGRIYNISKFQACKISKEGSAIVVKVKKKVHHDDWLGFSSDWKTVGSGEDFASWRLMRKPSVRLEETPPYLLKVVDAEIIHEIEIRQKASWTRLPAAFSGGERRQVLFSGMLFLPMVIICVNVWSHAMPEPTTLTPPPPPPLPACRYIFSSA